MLPELPEYKIEKRNKKLSYRIKGHRSFGQQELEHLLEYDPEILIIGKGQTGVLPIADEAQEILDNLDIEIITDITPNLIEKIIN
ncbi:MAG: hypothetical protein GF329_04425 [Candidatus Lokiarchaeota archaeon]|nr:hypothetical protein [Candidatus Lokiarchaeota archaeon]